MISDIWSIVIKEWKELLRQRGNLRGGMVGVLVFVGAFGIFMPLQFGQDWVNSPTQLIIWGWVPFLLITSVIADSFAGERERRTLETLLASRLSDRAILFGKVAAAIGYGWGLTMICLLIGLITMNVANWDGQILFYPWRIFLGIFGISLLISGLASGLGVLISLRASTVRQAQQTFSIAFMLLFLPMFLLPMLPKEWQERLLLWVTNADINAILGAVVVALFFVDVGLIAAALARFKRARLILD
jgi:ABC-2 type transport system permease protein